MKKWKNEKEKVYFHDCEESQETSQLANELILITLGQQCVPLSSFSLLGLLLFPQGAHILYSIIVITIILIIQNNKNNNNWNEYLNKDFVCELFRRRKRKHFIKQVPRKHSSILLLIKETLLMKQIIIIIIPIFLKNEILPRTSESISAIPTCCFSEQWFSNERITGYLFKSPFLLFFF